jgi:acetyl esterase/lipase
MEKREPTSGMTIMGTPTGMTRVVLTLALLSARADAVAWGDVPSEPKVMTRYNLIYNQAGATELKLDLVRPAEGEGPLPAVVVIHGGAWRMGQKSLMRGMLMQLARRGYVAIAPQYRFCPQETFPAQVHDVKAAVRWLKVHAVEYSVDAAHIGAIGFSAGGHLALMLGVTGPGDGLEGNAPPGSPDTKIQAVVNYFGPTDLTATDFPAITRSWNRDFLGGTPDEKPETAAQASPITFLTRDDPPVLSFQGTSDQFVPASQAVKLAEAQTRAGVPGRVELLVGARHGFDTPELDRTLTAAYAFFDLHLRPEPPEASP